MNVGQILQVVIGACLIFYIPGYLIMHYFYRHKKLEPLEKIALSIGLSVCITIIIGLILGLIGIFSIVSSAISYIIVMTGIICYAYRHRIMRFSNVKRAK